MLLQKWDYESHSYKDFESPAKGAILYTNDMNRVTHCANCGRKMVYGDGYTSKTIHNSVGFGYPVCEKCYNKELEEESEAELRVNKLSSEEEMQMAREMKKEVKTD